MRPAQSVLVTGAAGFIGSHLVDALLNQGHTVVGVDNLSRGRIANLTPALANDRFTFIEGDMTDLPFMRASVFSHPFDVVWHMVANSDIAAGVADPNVDLQSTFLTTFHLLSLMKEFGVGQLAFASTSAVYGVHEHALDENTGPLFPISNYGAMKLASEAMISAAVESFLQSAWIFRFPNVIGSRATHGIIFDFLGKLGKSDDELEVLGDGTQQKPYIHVSELVDGMLFIHEHGGDKLNWFNIGPQDEGVTVLQIARTVLATASPETPIRFTGGNRGWVGDVPKFRYSTEKLRRLGWAPTLTSQQALARATEEICREFSQ